MKVALEVSLIGISIGSIAAVIASYYLSKNK